MTSVNWTNVLKLTLFGAALIIISAFFCGDADAYDVPQDAVIKVFDANGTQIGEMSRSEYKVVKLGTSQEPSYIYTTLKRPVFIKERSHSLILHAGVGPTGGLETGHNGRSYTVESERGMIFGATYCFTKDGKGVCATGLTNKTGLVGFKKAW